MPPTASAHCVLPRLRTSVNRTFTTSQDCLQCFMGPHSLHQCDRLSQTLTATPTPQQALDVSDTKPSGTVSAPSSCSVWKGQQGSIPCTCHVPSCLIQSLGPCLGPQSPLGGQASYPRLIAAFHLGKLPLVSSSWVSKRRTPPSDHCSNTAVVLLGL